MSRGHAPPDAVLEWGPGHTSVLDLANRQLHLAATVTDAAGVLNGHRDVVIGLSRRAAFVRAVRVPNVGRAEVAQILRMQAGQLFPLPEGELAMDFQLTDDVSPEGRLAVISAVRESNLIRLNEEARDAGLRVQRVLPAAFGSVLVAREAGLRDCAVVARTSEGTAIDVIAGGQLRYSRTVPTENVEALEAEVLRTFSAAGVEPAPVIAVDGIALPGAVQGRVDPLEALSFPGVEALDIHLEPAGVVAAREQKRYQSQMRLAALLWAAAIVLLIGVVLDKSDDQSLYNKQVAAEKAGTTTLRKKRDAATARTSDVVSLQKALNQAFTPPQRLTDVVSVVTNAVPPDVWLSGITLERGRTLTLRGTARTNEALSFYLRRLTYDHRFRDVRLVFATNTTIEDTPVVEFSISAFPVGNVPLVEPAVKKGSSKAPSTRGTTKR